MFPSSWRCFVNRLMPASRPARPRSRRARLRCEELERRLQPAAFVFTTGVPDGKVATISEPASAHNSQVEFESADDFVLTSETKLTKASFTGLLTGGATPADVSNLVVEIYRVFPNDSDVGRTSGPPNFSTDRVPTRVNSPSDVAFDSRSAADQDLFFFPRVLSTSFTAQNSVSSPDKISVASHGNGPVTGEEVAFDVGFKTPIDLPAGHYFFVPQVGLSDTAPAGADFLWLSAPRPIAPPGTPFPPGFTDLQSWMRDDPPLAPDWLRIGTDIVGGTTFNATFTLAGQIVSPSIVGVNQTSAPAAGPGAMPGVNSGHLPAIIPVDLLAGAGTTTLSVLGGQNNFSGARTFTEGTPALPTPATQEMTFHKTYPHGLVTDPADPGHHGRMNRADGHANTFDADADTGGWFSSPSARPKNELHGPSK
jgi:hypothetical protein